MSPRWAIYRTRRKHEAGIEQSPPASDGLDDWFDGRGGLAEVRDLRGAPYQQLGFRDREVVLQFNWV